jgi:hypothetical protein
MFFAEFWNPNVPEIILSSRGKPPNNAMKAAEFPRCLPVQFYHFTQATKHSECEPEANPFPMSHGLPACPPFLPIAFSTSEVNVKFVYEMITGNPY